MANTAFDHASALTIPGSTTNNGLVRWGDTSGTSFGNITGITSDGSNITLLTRGEIRFSDADSSHFIAFESPATVSTSYTMALPAAVPSANDYLKVTSYSGGAGVLEWASVSADTNTTYSTSWVDSTDDAILRLTPSTGSADDLTIVAGSNITLTPSGDNLTIAAAGGTTVPLLLDQGSGDTYILELQSSDVAHGISGYDTNTFGLFMKKHATSGMLQMWGFSDADANQAIGLSLVGVSGIAADTAKTTSAIGIVEILGGIKNGSAIANPGTNGNILVVRDAASGAAKMIVDQSGAISKPTHPCFGTAVTSTISNITGNHDGYTVVWDSELFDQGGNLSGATFTAPVAGKYWFEAQLTLQGVASNHTEGYIRLQTTSGTIKEYINYFNPYNNETTVNSFSQVGITCMVDMTAGQTAQVNLKVSNGSKTVDINGSTNYHSRWSGMLVA